MLSLILFAFAVIGLAMCGIIVKLAGDRKKLRERLEVVPGLSEDVDGIACRNDTIALLDERIRTQGREIAEWRAKDQKRRADAKRASIKGHEAQAVIAAAKRAEQAMKRQAVNDELRAITGGLI